MSILRIHVSARCKCAGSFATTIKIVRDKEWIDQWCEMAQHFISTFARRPTFKLRDQLGGGDLGEADRLGVGGPFGGRLMRRSFVLRGVDGFVLHFGDGFSRDGFPVFRLLKHFFNDFIGCRRGRKGVHDGGLQIRNGYEFAVTKSASHLHHLVGDAMAHIAFGLDPRAEIAVLKALLDRN